MKLNFYKMKPFRRYLFSLLMATLVFSQGFVGTANAQSAITGRITAADDGSGMPGVNVLIKGSAMGTTTDADGKYSITANDKDAVLIFSFIGYVSQEVSASGRTIVDIVLNPDTRQLEEVVVTALGIQRSQASLGYAVGKVEGSALSRVAQENVLNGLAGKMPGVTINSTGATGSSVSMIIRGATSLGGDNQPLFVVDGVPVINGLNNISQIGNDNKADYGNPISDLNPENIESVSVLKGPSAAALYGSRANHGVVIITTKNGSKDHKMTVNITSNTVFDKPYHYLKMHSKYAIGVIPFTPDNNPYPGGILQIDEASAAGIGPELDKGYNAIQWNSPTDPVTGNKIPTPLVSHSDNVKNFVQTGITTINGVSIANSNENMNYRLSYANMSSRGIVPNSDLFKNSLSLNSSVKASSKVTISTNIDVSRSNSNNRPAGNRGANPLQWAYAVSPHIDIRDLENYWVPGKEGLQQLSQDNGKNYNNPYFLAYEVNNGFVRDRVFGNLKADWQITPELSLMGRYGLDTYNETRETKLANSYTGDARGAYGVINLKRFERNADFLLTYKKQINDFSLTASVGANSRSNVMSDVNTSTRNKTGLVIPGLFNIGNIAPANLFYSSYYGQKVVQSVYGLVNLGYKDMIYLDLTARNDWSSTLPEENRSYFYPSASLSAVISEMADLGSKISLLKLRAGYAQVGGDTNPYNLYNTLINNEAWGGVTRLSKSSTIMSPNLLPELATSFEYGLDFNMFENRLRFAATYYQVDNSNQILPSQLPSSSGFTSYNTNLGLLSSEGIELELGGTVLQNNDWRVDISANLSRNRTTIEKLPDGVESYTLWTDAKGGAWTYVGEKIGDIYDSELVTVTDQNSPYFGYPILDENGSWQSVAARKTRNKIGNFNPDFLFGGQVAVSYKAFSLNMAFDWRSGGDFVSQTYRYGESDMRTQRFLDNLINPGNMTPDELSAYLKANADDLVKVNGNNFNIVGGPTAESGGFPFEYGGNIYPTGVFNPGVIAQYDANGEISGYIENLGGADTKIIPLADNYPWDFTRAALFDASFIKLREISLNYAVPVTLANRIGMRAASVSLYSRNIMLWTQAKIGVDPETAYQPEASPQAGTQFKQGIERYNVTPWVMPIGFKINLTL